MVYHIWDERGQIALEFSPPPSRHGSMSHPFADCCQHCLPISRSSQRWSDGVGVRVGINGGRTPPAFCLGRTQVGWDCGDEEVGFVFKKGGKLPNAVKYVFYMRFALGSRLDRFGLKGVVIPSVSGARAIFG